jgi:hypothetical protein
MVEWNGGVVRGNPGVPGTRIVWTPGEILERIAGPGNSSVKLGEEFGDRMAAEEDCARGWSRVD